MRVSADWRRPILLGTKITALKVNKIIFMHWTFCIEDDASVLRKFNSFPLGYIHVKMKIVVARHCYNVAQMFISAFLGTTYIPTTSILSFRHVEMMTARNPEAGARPFLTSDFMLASCSLEQAAKETARGVRRSWRIFFVWGPCCDLTRKNLLHNTNGTKNSTLTMTILPIQ